MAKRYKMGRLGVSIIPASGHLRPDQSLREPLVSRKGAKEGRKVPISSISSVRLSEYSTESPRQFRDFSVALLTPITLPTSLS